MTAGGPATGPPGAGPGDRLSVEVLGTTVGLVVRGPAGVEVRARLAALLAPFASDPGAACSTTFTVGTGDDGRATLHHDGTTVVEGPWGVVEAQLLVALNAGAIAGYQGLAVHAGVVAAGRRVLAFPGASGAGKSTITAACLRSGFAYVSDEALCIDRTSHDVQAYPRPMALSRASCALVGLDPPADAARWAQDRPEEGREITVTAADLGAPMVPVDSRLRLTDVVELSRGATELHLESVHRARAVPALLAMSFNHYREPITSVEVVGALARDVRVWRLHYDDPLAAAALLGRELG